MYITYECLNSDKKEKKISIQDGWESRLTKLKILCTLGVGVIKETVVVYDWIKKRKVCFVNQVFVVQLVESDKGFQIGFRYNVSAKYVLSQLY